MNPFGQYGAGAPGTSPTQPSWIGPRNRAGAPTIKGVSALDSAAIMNDYENGKGTSRVQAEQAQDREKARQAVRAMSYEKGLMQKRKEMGLAGPQDEPKPVDPVAQRRANLIAGGLQPNEADLAVQQEQAAKAVKPVAAAPVPGAVNPPAPVAAVKPVADVPAPGGTTKNDAGQTVSLANTLADAKQRQANLANIGPQNSDIGLPSPGASADDEGQPRAKGGPVKAAKQKMMCRAAGGPVGGVTWVNPDVNAAGPVSKNRQVFEHSGVLGPTGTVVPRKKGGPVATGKKMPAKPQRVYKVGEKGPELFMPNRKAGKPAVVGQDGPETGQFPEDGVVVPNHALAAMKKKFQNQKTDDDGDEQPQMPVNKAKMKMRPQAA